MGSKELIEGCCYIYYGIDIVFTAGIMTSWENKICNTYNRRIHQYDKYRIFGWGKISEGNLEDFF
jgi:hypothetical protein